MKQGSKAAFLSLILLLGSCSDGPLIPELDSESLRISLPASGEFRSPSSLVRFSVTELDDTAEWTRFQAQLTNEDGVVLAVWSGDKTTPSTSLQLPDQFDDTRPGSLMTLELTVFDHDREVTAKKWEFFYVAETPQVDVAAQPLEAWPGSRVLLELLGAPPWGQETWVRWKWKNKTLALGPWGQDPVMRWDIPKEEGSYLLSAEIFPRIPVLGDFQFSSPLVVSVPVVATLREQVQPNELQPDDSYLYVYHFRGNLRDNGLHGAKGEQTFPEHRGLDVDRKSGVFGFAFKPGSEMRRRGIVLPIDSQSRLQPFSINFSGLDLAPGQVFSLKDDTGEFLLSLKREDRQWHLTWSLGGLSGNAGWPEDSPGAFQQTVSILPRMDGGDLLWYSQAEVVHSSSWIWETVPEISAQGELILGGEGSFSGIMDEWGLYFKDESGRPSADGTLLLRQRTLTTSGTLVWAAGFDGSYLDEGFLLSPDGVLKPGSLELSGDSWVRSPLLETAEGVYLLELAGTPGGKIQLQRQFSDGQVLDLGTVDLLDGVSSALLQIGNPGERPDDPMKRPVFLWEASPPDSYLRLKPAGEGNITVDYLIYSELPRLTEEEENTSRS